MPDSEAMRLRDDFLARLDAAMRDLPHGIATDLRVGIAEELSGADAAATRARIAQLGDPATIAREAQRATETPQAEASVIVVAPEKIPLVNTRGYAIVAGLAVGFGGIVVPFFGWFLGAALMCFSPLWTRLEKILTILVPFIYLGLIAVVALIGRAVNGEVEAPLNPLSFDVGWSAMLVLGVVMLPLTGLWLLWQLRGRR